MSIVTAPAELVALPPTNLPIQDGIPLESDWHRLEMNLLIELVFLHLMGRQDYFVGGNMFIYFDAEQVRNRNFRGPDFFFVKDSSLNPPRKYWAVWDEGGRYPDVIIELASPSTLDEDHGIKKTTYEKVFRTYEYFIYDPNGHKLQGWRLTGNKQNYVAIQPNEKGWLQSKMLGLWLGTWEGKLLGKEDTYLRYFDDQGNLILNAHERTEIARLRADAEKQRADAIEAELALLKAQLKKSAP